MPSTPHPITVTVYDTDNSTILEGAKVYVRNATKRTSSDEKTTNSSGQVIIDLANLDTASGQTEPYSSSDKILIIAYHGNNHDAKLYEVTGSSKSQTLYMNPARHTSTLDTEKIRAIVVANTHTSTGYYAKVYAVDDAQMLCHIECKAGETESAFLDGLPASGGYVIDRESNVLIVTTSLK